MPSHNYKKSRNFFNMNGFCSILHINDIIIFNATMLEHEKHLQWVFKKLKNPYWIEVTSREVQVFYV
jgi:hypothetical protein